MGLLIGLERCQKFAIVAAAGGVLSVSEVHLIDGLYSWVSVLLKGDSL